MEPRCLCPFSTQSKPLEEAFQDQVLSRINLELLSNKKRYKKNFLEADSACAGDLGRRKVRSGMGALWHISKSQDSLRGFQYKPGNTDKKREEAMSLCLLKLTLSWLFKYGEDASLSMYPTSKNLRILCNTVLVHRAWRKIEKMYNQLVISRVFLWLYH